MKCLLSAIKILGGFVFLMMVLAQPTLAMHITEGFLPPVWAALWSLISFPLVLWGLWATNRVIKQNPRYKMLLALTGAFTFVLSALKLPSVTGSCSHATGIALGAICFGLGPMVVIGMIVLLFQALLLAHGGLTTLGANVFSMAIAGSLVAVGVFYGLKKVKVPFWLAVFLAATLSDLATYAVTAVQLALAFPTPEGGFAASLVKFLVVFGLTQVPLAISEGLLTVLVFNTLKNYHLEELKELKVFAGEEL